MINEIKQLEQELKGLELDSMEAEFGFRNQGFSNRNNRRNRNDWDSWKGLNVQREAKEKELAEARSKARDKMRNASADSRLLMGMMDFLWRKTMDEQDNTAPAST